MHFKAVGNKTLGFNFFLLSARLRRSTAVSPSQKRPRRTCGGCDDTRGDRSGWNQDRAVAPPVQPLDPVWLVEFKREEV